MMEPVSEAEKAFVVKSNMAPLFDDMAAAVLKDKPENIPAYLIDWLGKVLPISMMEPVSEAEKAFVVKSNMEPLFDDMAAAVLKDKPENIPAYLIYWLGKVCTPPPPLVIATPL